MRVLSSVSDSLVGLGTCLQQVGAIHTGPTPADTDTATGTGTH
jgi:hypothetical protein